MKMSKLEDCKKEIKLLILNLRYDFERCNITGLIAEKITQQINAIEKSIEELERQVKD